MKKCTLLTAFVLASGCAVHPDPNLPKNAVIEPTPGHYDHVKELKYSFKTTPNTQKKLKECVAINVENPQVNLSDDSRSFVGAYSGTYYQAGNRSTIAGGQVLRFASKDKVVADGRVNSYHTANFGVRINYTNQFKLIIDASKPTTTVLFTDLKRAQLSTGGFSNDGFGYIYTLDALYPSKSTQAIEGIYKKLKACLL